MTGKVNSIPEGFHTVTPYLIVQEADQLIDFVKQAFGAAELMRTTGEGKRCRRRSTCKWMMLTRYISVRFRQAPPRLRSRRTSPMGIAWQG